MIFKTKDRQGMDEGDEIATEIMLEAIVIAKEISGLLSKKKPNESCTLAIAVLVSGLAHQQKDPKLFLEFFVNACIGIMDQVPKNSSQGNQQI